MEKKTDPTQFLSSTPNRPGRASHAPVVNAQQLCLVPVSRSHTSSRSPSRFTSPSYDISHMIREPSPVYLNIKVRFQTKAAKKYFPTELRPVQYLIAGPSEFQSPPPNTNLKLSASPSIQQPALPHPEQQDGTYLDGSHWLDAVQPHQSPRPSSPRSSDYYSCNDDSSGLSPGAQQREDNRNSEIKETNSSEDRPKPRQTAKQGRDLPIPRTFTPTKAKQQLRSPPSSPGSVESYLTCLSRFVQQGEKKRKRKQGKITKRKEHCSMPVRTAEHSIQDTPSSTRTRQLQRSRRPSPSASSVETYFTCRSRFVRQREGEKKGKQEKMSKLKELPKPSLVQQRGEGKMINTPATIKDAPVNKFKFELSPEKGGKRWQCLECEKSFSKKGFLKTHMLSHDKPFACLKCPKQFMYKSNLVNHNKTHNSSIKCADCGGSFDSQKDLTEHIKSKEVMMDSSYSKYRFGPCPKCGRYLANKTNFDKHMLWHTDDSENRPFKCAHCSKTFWYKRHCSKHENYCIPQ